MMYKWVDHGSQVAIHRLSSSNAFMYFSRRGRSKKDFDFHLGKSGK